MERVPPIEILGIAHQLLGERPINGHTGTMEKFLHDTYRGKPVKMDSARTCHRAGGAQGESERIRTSQLFFYGLMETNNYNMSCLSDQLTKQGGVLKNVEEAYTSHALVPEVRTELSLLLNEKLMINRPGFIGESFDIRELAASCKLSAKAVADRWRQMAREIVDEVLPKEVQVCYSGAANATMYLPLPDDFFDGIVHCCAVSSRYDAATLKACLPSIRDNVRHAITLKLSEARKNKSMEIKELVRVALMKTNWCPPGITREQAFAMYGVPRGETDGDSVREDVPQQSGAEQESQQTPTTRPTATTTDTPAGDHQQEMIMGNLDLLQTPTSSLKRKGPRRTTDRGVSKMMKGRFNQSIGQGDFGLEHLGYQQDDRGYQAMATSSRMPSYSSHHRAPFTHSMGSQDGRHLPAAVDRQHLQPRATPIVQPSLPHLSARDHQALPLALNSESNQLSSGSEEVPVYTEMASVSLENPYASDSRYDPGNFGGGDNFFHLHRDGNNGFF